MFDCIVCNDKTKASSGKCSHSACFTVCVFLLWVSVLEKENIFPSYERSEGELKKNHSTSPHPITYLSVFNLSLYHLRVRGEAYKSYLNRILILQKRALRFMYFTKRNKHTIPLFINAKILPLN